MIVIKDRKKTILCVLDEDDENSFSETQIKSLKQVKEMVKNNGANVFDSLEDIASFLNKTNKNDLIENYIIKKMKNNKEK